MATSVSKILFRRVFCFSIAPNSSKYFRTNGVPLEIKKGQTPIGELTKDFDVDILKEKGKFVEGSFHAENVISPTFDEIKLTARRIPVCDICSCLLRFEEFEDERCGSCQK